MIEGYSHSKRRFLNDLKTESDVVRVDGVGGCVLLVAADLHRSGLVFPPFVFDRHIETEGMAKMAARMGVKLYGLPSVNIIHAWTPRPHTLRTQPPLREKPPLGHNSRLL